MLNEKKESQFYQYSPEDKDDINKYVKVLKSDTLIPKLGGVKKAMTVIARDALFSSDPGRHPSEEDARNALVRIEEWCRYPSGRLDEVTEAIAELEDLDLGNLSDDDKALITKARELFDALGIADGNNGKKAINNGVKLKEQVLNYSILKSAEQAMNSPKSDKDSSGSDDDSEEIVIAFFRETKLESVSIDDVWNYEEKVKSSFEKNELKNLINSLIMDGVLTGWYITDNTYSDNTESNEESDRKLWKRRKTIYLSRYNYDELSRSGLKDAKNIESEGLLYKQINALFTEKIKKLCGGMHLSFNYKSVIKRIEILYNYALSYLLGFNESSVVLMDELLRCNDEEKIRKRLPEIVTTCLECFTDENGKAIDIDKATYKDAHKIIYKNPKKASDKAFIFSIRFSLLNNIWTYFYSNTSGNSAYKNDKVYTDNEKKYNWLKDVYVSFFGQFDILKSYCSCKNEDERFDTINKFLDICSPKQAKEIKDYLIARSKLRKGVLYEFKKLNPYDFRNDANKISYEKILADAFNAGPLKNSYLVADRNWQNLLKKVTDPGNYHELNVSDRDGFLKIVGTYLQNKQGKEKWAAVNKQEIGNWLTGESGENKVYNIINKTVYENPESLEALEWIVLEKKEDYLVLLCRKAIAYGEITHKYSSTPSWNASYIRKNVIPDLAADIFSEEDIKKIQRIKIQMTQKGAPSFDLFQLSKEEFEKYAKNPVLEKEIKNCENTEHLESEIKHFGLKCDCWNLRYPGEHVTIPCVNHKYGTIDNRPASGEVFLIRPAVCLKNSPEKIECVAGNETAINKLEAGDIIRFGKYYVNCEYVKEPAISNMSIGKNASKLRLHENLLRHFELRDESEFADFENGNPQIPGYLFGKEVLEDTCYSDCRYIFFKVEKGLRLEITVVNPQSSVIDSLTSCFVGVDGHGTCKIKENKDDSFTVNFSGKKGQKKYTFNAAECKEICGLKQFRFTLETKNEIQEFLQFANEFYKAFKNTTDTTFRKIYEIDESGNLLECRQIANLKEYIMGFQAEKTGSVSKEKNPPLFAVDYVEE